MDPIQKALAELRAIPMSRPKTVEEPPGPACCTGDRRGYQWHQRTKNLPACAESQAAAAAYMRDYAARRGGWQGLQRRGSAKGSAA
ncbi:hypothetical protein IQ62_00105 [Streptomyces scabiei]|uniref:hypothetical protein n=1 Tax=Streptomyces scabiei TaxID=1930 RepID=UPI0004E66C92|nr:hypothetical protein [Streptomyces scabiei]KFG02759.1 hypothetical protein IQ62_00105 [Streptomyces scabiei]